MKRAVNNARHRTGRAEVTRRQTLPRDRRSHDRVAAVKQFREWDQAMQRRHGPLYYRAMGWTLH